jgi:hypothetical protein
MQNMRSDSECEGEKEEEQEGGGWSGLGSVSQTCGNRGPLHRRSTHAQNSSTISTRRVCVLCG